MSGRMGPACGMRSNLECEQTWGVIKLGIESNLGRHARKDNVPAPAGARCFSCACPRWREEHPLARSVRPSASEVLKPHELQDALHRHVGQRHSLERPADGTMATTCAVALPIALLAPLVAITPRAARALQARHGGKSAIVARAAGMTESPPHNAESTRWREVPRPCAEWLRKHKSWTI